MRTIALIATTSLSLALFACAKKTEPVTVEPPPPATHVEVAQPTPPPQQPSSADALEAERRRLEELINRIMNEDVYFEFDQATLTAAAKDILGQVGEILKRETRFTVLTEGHTDERGTESYNLGLGTRRAEAVVNFLVNYGVDPKRLSKRSLGQEQPKADGHSEDAWAQNRRASFRVQTNN
ncbi:MAG: OmpA family protein [Fibromonadaceae bacterium]|jgi:peptidoglycan-associated lipoprotein|nr:OmpA family protein [Fibromonadaceae bacterium]